MYARLIDGIEYRFGVSGKLYRNGLIMYDDVTGSLWSHVAGRAVVGDLAGTELELMSAIHTDWHWVRWVGLSYQQTKASPLITHQAVLAG